jgi:LEA14-like dessication related protein
MIPLLRTPCVCRVLVLGFATLLAGCGLLRSGLVDPEVALVGLRMGPGDGLNQTVMVGLLVTNPNSIDLKLNAIQYRIRLDGRDLVSGSSREPFEVPAGDSARYEVPATINLLSGFGFIKSMLSKPRDKIGYELNATLEPAGLFAMPITVRKADTVSLSR